jgi:hypothetical protein
MREKSFRAATYVSDDAVAAFQSAKKKGSDSEGRTHERAA